MRTPFLIVAIAIATLTGGCASRAASTAGAAPTPSPTSGCPATLAITATDASKALCVQVGGVVTVSLVPQNQKPWLPIDVSGTALQPVNDSTGSVAVGSQMQSFTAISTGTAAIMSSYRACPPMPATISCNAIVAWKVTVQVK